MNTYILSVSAQDKSGLIAAVTGCLFDLGANCGDTNFAVLGQGSEMTCVFDLPAEIVVDDINQGLAELEELSAAKYDIKPFSYSKDHNESATITHLITIHGGDHQGLLAQLSETFIQFNANIVRLSSRQIEGSDGMEYHIEMSVFIPQSTQESCLAVVGNTASSLQLSFNAVAV
ncbi:MAG: amino acid-binding protein [Gammaproteobacteria bacterium]|nr:amino acid-binding protein [Gammaproteobacteria bacterium]